MQMGPGALMWVRGHEGYLGGKGQMQWKLWGAVQLAKQEGPQVDQSALVRYLAGRYWPYSIGAASLTALGQLTL
jgi:hypothetical protein